MEMATDFHHHLPHSPPGCKGWLQPLEGAWTAPPGVDADALEVVTVRADEAIEDQAPRLLSAREQERYGSLRLPKRRREWLGGRMAAKLASFLLLHGSPPREMEELAAIEIASDAQGRPRPGKGEPPYLSITHWEGVAAAAASHFPCGIDLQGFAPGLVRVRSRFLTRDEFETASPPLGGDEPLLLACAWAAKEAIRKLVRRTPLVTMEEQAITSMEPLDQHDSWRCTIRWGAESRDVLLRRSCGAILALALEGMD